MIVFLVEDYSMRKFLEGVLPRLGFDEHSIVQRIDGWFGV